MNTLKVKRTSERGILPVRANSNDAGLDLFCPVRCVIAPYSSELISFDIAIELAPNTVGLIYARSSIGGKHGIRPRNCVGVIDEKYRDSLLMVVENSSTVHYAIERGDRIAQLVITPVLYPEVVEVDELDHTDDRGGGYGSTEAKVFKKFGIEFPVKE